MARKLFPTRRLLSSLTNAPVMEVSQLFSAFPPIDAKTSIFDPSADDLEFYEGAFFNPARLNQIQSHPPTSQNQDSQVLLGHTDSNRQFLRFEQSIFRLDRLLSRRHSKTNSLPLQSDLPVSNQETITQEVDTNEETKGWLDSILIIGENAKKEARREALRMVKLSDVLKKSLLVTEEQAVKAEEEILFELRQKKDSAELTKAPSIEVSSEAFEGKILVLDHGSLKLIDTHHLRQLLTTLIGPKTAPEAKRSVLERTYHKWLLNQLETCPFTRFDCSLVPAVGNVREIIDALKPLRIKRPRKPRVADELSLAAEGNLEDKLEENVGENMAASKEWTEEDDNQLCSYVDAYQKRKSKVTKAFKEWHQSPTDSEAGMEASMGLWELVAGQLETKRTGKSCKNRWLILQKVHI